MKLEAYCFFVTAAKGEDLIVEHSVPAGRYDEIAFLGKETDVLALCSDNEGIVYVSDPKKELEIYRYEKDFNKDREKIAPPELDDKPITISIVGKQKLSIMRKGELTRDVLVCLSSSDTQTQDSPQRELEKKLSEPVFIAS